MKTINAQQLKTMLKYATDNIVAYCEYIDELNIFPVPDGDTGTNMKITITGAYNEIANLATNDLSVLTKTFSHGLLLNAHGNSGVILSQIFKGFSLQFMQNDLEMSIDDMIGALAKAKESAYKAVSFPVEGTILTVIREVADKLVNKKRSFTTFKNLFDFICLTSETALNKTPDLLPELKEANVVDSGAYGLNKILEGMREAIIAFSNNKKPLDHDSNLIIPKKTSSLFSTKKFVDDNNGFGYCCEFIMNLGSKVIANQPKKEKFDEQGFKKHIKSMGDSFVYAHDGDLVKVHIHMIKPHELLEYASKFGEFNKIKIENMTMQFIANNPNETTLQTKLKLDEKDMTNEPKLCAIVPTDAVAKVYSKKLAVKNTLNCFSTNIPSTHQIFSLIKETKSKNIILITNNGNEIMASKEAINLVPQKKSTIHLLPAKDIATSYLLALAFDPNKSLNDNFKTMSKLFKTIVSGKIAMSVKEISYRKVNVKVGDYIGIMNDNIIISSKNISFIIKKLIDELFDKIHKPKKVVVIYGSDASISDVKDVEKYIYEEYGKKPIMISGQQTIYYFYIGISR